MRVRMRLKTMTQDKDYSSFAGRFIRAKIYDAVKIIRKTGGKNNRKVISFSVLKYLSRFRDE